ncbi:MAG: HAMP domain-containing sensor histidine kinase [Pseudomonadota bacterium]
MKASKQKWAALKFRKKIRNALLLYYLTPIFLILTTSASLFYYTTKRNLDEEMGKRLVAIAHSAASQVRAFHMTVLDLKDASTVTHQTLLRRFETIRDVNGVARVYLFNFSDESLLDTDPASAPGSTYGRNRIHRTEIEAARNQRPTSSVLFQGSDGSYYKSAFAPVVDEGKVLAVIGVDGSATFFQSLHRLGSLLIYFALACIAIIVLVSMIISRQIVTPIQGLVASAQRIGEGHLEEPIPIRSENEIGFLSFVLDEMRKNIVARDRELQVMLRGVAHEVRNPLGGMELFAGILAEEPQVTKDPKLKDAVTRIQNEIATLKHLVEEFLDFARGPTLQSVSVDLKSFFEEIRIAFAKEMEQKGIRFATSFDGIEQGEFDPDQMRRVFLNLVVNSLQAMPRGGEIAIRARGENGQFEITVSDTGIGIPPENLERLFDPFFTTKEQGTGLGLSFARKIVNAHGGELRVESTPGAGTNVSVVLPR